MKQSLISIMSRQACLTMPRTTMLTSPLTPTRFGKTLSHKTQSLEKIVSALPPVVYSTQPHIPTDNEPEGALVYIRTGTRKRRPGMDRS